MIGRLKVVCRRPLAFSRSSTQYPLRLLSSDGKQEDEAVSPSKMKYLTPMIFGGGAIVLYGVSSLTFDLIYSFMSLTPAATGYYGFLAGSISAIGFGSVIGTGLRNTGINVAACRRKSLTMVNNSSTVRSVLGGGAQPSEYCAFKATAGYWWIKDGKLTWSPAKATITYDVAGPKGRGIVAVQAARLGLLGKDEFNFIGFQSVERDNKNTPILIAGDASHIEILNSLDSVLKRK